MQIALFEKNGTIIDSPIYMAYAILKQFKRQKSISIYKLLDTIKKVNPESNPKQFIYALMFLYMNEIILFEEPFITIQNADS